MTPQPKRYITEEEYSELEQTSTIKHEYYQGEIYAMTGGTENHNLLGGNIHATLHTQLRRRPCKVYNSDQKIKVLATGLHTYPDVTVACGEAQFIDRPHLTLINPIVIVEVLSPSTERYDRGMKFQHYRTISTLQEYLLIAQDQHRIECYVRQESGVWLLSEAIGLEARVTLRSIDCTLTLEDVYEKVVLEEDDEGLPRNQSTKESDEVI